MQFSRPEYWSGFTGVKPFPSPGDLPNPGSKPRSPALQADSLPAELQGKSKNTGVGSLSLLQQIFPTQGLNRGLLHCRWILYQLSYEGSPVAYIILHCSFKNFIRKTNTDGTMESMFVSPQNSYVEVLLSSVMVFGYGGETESCSVVSDSLGPHGLYSPWNSPA